MKREMYSNFIICILAWCIGIGLSMLGFYHVSPDTQVLFSGYNHNTEMVPLINNAVYFTFLKIFTHNLVVGIFLSIIGFFTGGIFTLIIFIWNGFIIGVIVQVATVSMSSEDILEKLIHCPVEITALAWFGSIGLLGLSNIKNIFQNTPLSIDMLPGVKAFLKPTVLLLIAAIIETSLFAFQT